MLKKLIVFVAFAALCHAVVAQKPATIEVKVSDERAKELLFCKNVDGRMEVFNTWQANGEGILSISFLPDYEGFYCLKMKDSYSRFPLYLKEGDKVMIELKDLSGHLYGENTPENLLLYEWEGMSEQVRKFSQEFVHVFSTFEDLYPALEELIDRKEEFKKCIKTGNGTFNRLMEMYTDRSIDFYAINPISTPRMKHPAKDDFPPFFKDVTDSSKFDSDSILLLPFGYDLVTMLPVFYMNPDDFINDLYVESLKLGNDRLKGEYFIHHGYRIEKYNEYLELRKRALEFMSEEQMKRFDKFGAPLYEMEIGMEAADFTYPDVDGNPVTLSDFKGKVVLVDVWATWCGPCKTEIPHLKKLEEDYAGTDLVVISVSVDEQKNYEKWKQMIADEQLGGIQLFAGGLGKIMDDYKIKGIPHFLVFGREGTLADFNAPRPSSEKLRKLLDDELAK